MDRSLCEAQARSQSRTSTRGNLGDRRPLAVELSRYEPGTQHWNLAVVADAVQQRAHFIADARSHGGGGGVCSADCVRECWQSAVGSLICASSRNECAD